METYQSIFNSAPDGMLLVSLAGEIVEANAQAESMFGYGKGELAGRMIEALIPDRYHNHPKHRSDYFAEPHTRTMGQGLELFGRRKNDSEFPVDIMLSPLQTSKGTRTLCVVRDVTLREVDREEKSRLAAIVDSANEAIIGKNLDGKITSWNPAAERLFGYSAQEAIGKHISMLIPPDLRVEEDAIMSRIHHGERVPAYETVRLHKDGSPIDVWLTVSPIRDRHGRIVAASKILNDIRDQRAAEKLFRGFVETAPDAIVVVNDKGQIILVNTQTEALFGYKRDELIGQRIEMLIPERVRNGHSDLRKGYFHRPRTRGMGIGQELYALHRDRREFPVEISLSPLHTKDGILVSSSIRDITQRKEIEQKLKKSLHEKETMLKEIHHRVKNNLAVISSLFYLQTNHIEDERLIKILQESQNRVRSMAMVHESLYSSNNLNNVDLAEYASNLANQLVRNYSAHEQICLRIAMQSTPLSIEVAVPCGLILNEIITNSIKHAFPNGRKGEIFLSLQHEPSGEILLSVKDDGVGLPANFNSHEHKSLGLRLIHSLTRQIDGRYEFLLGRVGTETNIRFGFRNGEKK